MANSGTFRKGEKRPNQGKHGSPRATANAREAIARFVDNNAGKLQEWLDEIKQTHGAMAAYRCFMDVVEYHVPKLARHEVTGEDGPVELVVRWQDSSKH